VGALIDIESVTLASPRPNGLAGAHIDGPRPGERVEAHAIEVRGWALGGERPAVAVELWCEGRLARRVPLTLARQDLVKVFPDIPWAGAAGFRTTVAGLGRDPAMEIELRAVLGDQRRVPLARIVGRRRWREGPDADAPLVSVVIPCYGQAHYLGEAIESVLAQTYPHLEIVVVDDGSPDNTSEVAGAYPGVRVVRQENGGLAAARNTGLRSSSGAYLVFLDSDDRLLPEALEIGLQAFARHPEAALVWGGRALIGPGGERLAGASAPALRGSPYRALLRECVIWVPAAVMYRRALFEELGGFDPTVSASADYDLYLRATRDFPAHQHGELVAEYRRHGANMTLRPEVILRSELEVLRRQRRHVRRDPDGRRALREGLRRARAKHAPGVSEQLAERLLEGRWADARQLAALLARHHPSGLPAAGARLAAELAERRRAAGSSRSRA
jgi:glycosyltransferase involved in cell wall biosynthesis